MKKSIIICALAAVLAGALLSTACSREDSGSAGAVGSGTATGEQHTAVETELTHDSTTSDAPRLSVEAVEAIITASHSAVEFYNNIRSRYAVDSAYPFSGRVGGVNQYWLDDEGTEWIELVVVPNNDNEWVVEWIALKNHDDYWGSGKTLYSDTDLKALFGEEQ